jgi:hypothetical protein
MAKGPDEYTEVEAIREGVPSCALCARYELDGTCLAFPLSIPDEIILYGFDHTKPFKGDGGIRFEPRR